MSNKDKKNFFESRAKILKYVESQKQKFFVAQGDVNINNHPIFNDLYGYKFDNSWHDSFGNETGKTYSIIPGEDTKDDGNVKYIYNSENFRSDNFTKTHNGKHILFSGCSESEGVGANIEDAWTNILYKKISKEEECSGFFNLSRSGWGWNKIILNSLIYFKKYGYPDVMFVLLPNCQRKFVFNESEFLDDAGNLAGHWQYQQHYPIINKHQGEDSRFFTTVKQYNEDFIAFLINWKTFNELCKSNNIKLFFATWANTDVENLLKINMFNNLVNVDTSPQLEKVVADYYKDHESQKYDIIKRDGHHGRISHNFWSEQFYQKYKSEND